MILKSRYAGESVMSPDPQVVDECLPDQHKPRYNLSALPVTEGF